MSATKIRNVAIIAHVDHGKTTLVDALLKQTSTKLKKDLQQAELIMDSNELEKERGITIFSKNASVRWQDYKINIVDTPGHADFGGEVERVLTLVDGCLLLIDAKEGPMPQTRFVLKRALEMKLKILVVINKIDKPDARPDYALNKTFDLFVELGADDQSLDFPVIYAASKQGKAGLNADLNAMSDISPIFEAIVKHIPDPQGDPNNPLQILITSLSSDQFKGRLATGRVCQGSVVNGQTVAHINRAGAIKKYRLLSLMVFEGLDRIETNQAEAGDIVALAGIPDITIGETVADADNPNRLPLLDVEEPTVKISVMVNDSPFAGQEGQFTTSRQIKERLLKELETDVALRVEEIQPGLWSVAGRGELHLAIFLERLRREGFELQVSQPQVINKTIDGITLTPYEQLFIEVPEDYSGIVIQKLGARRGELKEMKVDSGLTLLEFIIPTKGLLGYRSEFITDTRGLGIMNSLFYDYQPDPGNWRGKEQGSLVAHESGLTNLYGLLNVQDRGIMFVGPGVKVYKGQVVGQNAREKDLRVNVCKTKQLSNMRSKGEGSAEHFDKPKDMDLEDALEYIGADELVEITPQNIRLRKKILDEVEARRKELGIK